MKKYMIAILLLLGSAISIGCSLFLPEPWSKPPVYANASLLTGTSTPEQLGLRYLESSLRTHDGLIASNSVKKVQTQFCLLESMGQAMEYAALLGDQPLFEYYADVTHHFFKPAPFYPWKLQLPSKKPEKASALLDDLRLARAYLTAQTRFGGYDKELKQISDTLLATDIKDGFPVDFYDGDTKKTADHVSLFYLDTQTMQQLQSIDPHWQQPFLQANGILAHMPENAHGFYPQSYNIKEQTYQWSDTINMVENLYTAMYAAEAGRGTALFREFLKRQLASGALYNHYDQNGVPAGHEESTAVYALAVRFFSQQQEPEAAAACYHHMLSFQQQTDDSDNGSFGQASHAEIYAFDQLEALLTIRMVEKKNDETH